MKWSLSRWFSSRPSPANKSNVAPRRLKLEALEERAVPGRIACNQSGPARVAHCFSREHFVF